MLFESDIQAKQGEYRNLVRKVEKARELQLTERALKKDQSLNTSRTSTWRAGFSRFLTTIARSVKM